MRLFKDRAAGRLAAGALWTISYLWIGLKSAGWLGAIVLICVSTFAVSSLATQMMRRRKTVLHY